MASKWRILSLRKAKVELIDCDHRTPPPATEGYAYVAIPQLRNGRINFSDARRITETHFVDWTRKAKPIENDVVLSRRCNPGETAFVPPNVKFALGQNLVMLRADGTEVYPPFLRWLVRGPEWWEQIGKFLNVGAVFDSLRCADIPKFQLLIPPLEEQRAIAHILGTLDDKIELNRKRNDTLEAMARALFQSWFVDFDPVRAKAAVRREHPRWTDAEVCRAALPTLAPEIAALFPESFENSELGEIPNGWRVGSLSDVALLNPESWSRATKPEIIRYIDLANTKWSRIEAITAYSKENAPSRAQRVLRCGDTIVGTVRPGNGSYALIAEEGLTGSTGFAVLRPRQSEYREFIYLAATAQDNIESLAHLADGGAYPAVRPEVVIAKQIVTLPDAVIAHFSKLTGPLISRVAQRERESHTLGALRDTLLPKLISGELRIKNVERYVEGAL